MLRLKLSLLVAIFTFAQTSFAISESDAEAFSDIIDLAAATIVLTPGVDLVDENGAIVDASDTSVFHRASDTVRIKTELGTIVHTLTVNDDDSATISFSFYGNDEQYVCGHSVDLQAGVSPDQVRRATVVAQNAVDGCAAALARKMKLNNKRMPAGVIGLAIGIAQLSGLAYFSAEAYREVKGTYPGQKRIAAGKGTAVALTNSKGNIIGRAAGLIVKGNNFAWHNKYFGKGTSLKKRLIAAGLIVSAIFI